MEIMSAGELFAKNYKMRAPVIEGILRDRETAVIIAPPKFGTSFTALSLAFSVAKGVDWLGCKCVSGKVLVIDTDHHQEIIAERVKLVAKATATNAEELKGKIHLQFTRGEKPTTISDLDKLLMSIKNPYSLIIVDSLYGLTSKSTTDSGIAEVFDVIDRHAERLGASFAVLIKGSWASQLRAFDSVISIQGHANAARVVVDSRSYLPMSFNIEKDGVLWKRE